MASKDEMMRAAKAFWGPQKIGTRVHTTHHIADIILLVRKEWRDIALRNSMVASHWETGDIRLLQLRAMSQYQAPDDKLATAELLYWIVAEGARSPPEELPHIRRPPETILDLITVEYDGKTETTWLIGELYDDRVKIKSDWTDDPFAIGSDGLHAKWMDGTGTWLELSADPMDEYNRVFRRPIEAEEVPEIPTMPTGLETLQKAIDDIERDIRQLRAKERDFTSSNTEMAHRLGKQHEYEELLRQRDEHLWRENPKLPARFDKSILVGATPDEIVQVDIHIGDGRNTAENQSLSFTGTTYSRNAFTKEDGEERARDSLMDGELWKDAVANQTTTESLEEWTERVLNSDGWEQILGDVVEIGNDKYTMSEGGGQIDMSVKVDDFVELAIDKKDLEAIWQSWSKYHLKRLSEVTKVAEKMRAVFDKYPDFSPQQMLRFTDMSPIEPDVEEESEVESTRISGIQEAIDAIERDIRALRAKERDFTSENIEVAERLGKRAEYERLLKERDEAMWRENPCHRVKRAA